MRLLEKFGQACAAIEQSLRRRVEIGPELREGGHFAVLRELALDATGDLLHRLGLRGRAHARHRQAHVHGWANALIEKVGFQEDLPVGNGDDVGRNVGGHVVGLRLDDRQRGQRACLVLVIHLGRALEQARMQIEHVAWIGFAARRTAQQQRHLAVCDGLLGKVIIDDDGMHSVVAEIFTHGATGKRRQVLHRRRIGSGRRDNDRIVERALLLEHLHELRDGRALLANRNIDAIELDLLVRLRIERFLIEDRVERDRGLAGLTVADDQLTLAATDRN